MKRAFAMKVASMLPRNWVNSPVKSGAIANACSAKSATTARRSIGKRRFGAWPIRKVWVTDSAGDGYVFRSRPKCDRSETSGDRLGLTDLELLGWHAHVDLDTPFHDPHRVGVHRIDRRQRAHLAGQQIELPAMSRALDLTVAELALAEHPAVVGAHVVDGAPGAVLAVTEAEALRAGVHDLDLAARNLVLARDRDEAAHSRTPISAMFPMRGRTAFSTRWRTCSSLSSLMTRRKK